MPDAPCLKRAHYGSVTVYRPSLDRMAEAMAEVKEKNLCRAVSNAMDQWSEKVLRRRDRRLLRLAARNSRNGLNHKVTTT